MHDYVQPEPPADAWISNRFQTSHWYTCGEFADGTLSTVFPWLWIYDVAGLWRSRHRGLVWQVLRREGVPLQTLGSLTDSFGTTIRTSVYLEGTSQK